MWWTSRYEKLSERITALEKRENSLDDLPLKWENTLDLLKKLVARLNARDKTLSAPENDKEAPGEPVAPPALTGTHGRLQEMRRRRGLLSG